MDTLQLNNPDINQAGLYLHIPFCKRKCSYCNFHFSTLLHTKAALLDSMIREIEMRKAEASGYAISSVYFGGGTPSLLSNEELSRLTAAIQQHYVVSEHAEWTIECNPEDIQPEYLEFLHDTGFNRISIGIQSFLQEDLEWMNRAHNADQAHYAMESVLQGPVKNFSLDLIYGLPDSNYEKWNLNLHQISHYQVPHFSAYALTLEERTKLMHLNKKGTLQPASDVDTVEQLYQLMDYAESNEYEHYEISNFAKIGYRSRHNSSYWEGQPYIGFGPSAHSFDGRQRRWNIANNALYTKAVHDNQHFFETEHLSRKEQYNEYIMLQIRKKEGIHAGVIEQKFPEYASHFYAACKSEVESGKLLQIQNFFKLSRKGLPLADQLAVQLFLS